MGDPSHKVSFKEALFNGITPDRSLYFPTNISPLKGSFIQNLDNLSNEEIAYECVSQFVSSDITEVSVESIIKETINFDFPVKRIDDDISVLELFHGPTMAFKDVGARFTSRCLSYFISKEYYKKVTVLVATSGDTGAAVASGFYEVDGVDVFILYPSGKISEVQEKQISTYSKNIFAVEVDGTRTLIHENESTYIPMGSIHRLSNPGKIPLRVIEVQSGSCLGEDDIERYEDDYARSDP